jgi:glycerophosphoryl diester phosphodiesterase
MRNLKKSALIILPVIGLLSASFIVKDNLSAKKHYPAFFKIGHRGTRGLMPENTIPAMIKAVQIGANTLEMDVHITRDGKVIVYHDESFDPAYTQMPDGSEIPPAGRKKYTFYQMDYADIKPFIIGKKPYPAFPQQQLTPTYTPLLSELIDSVDTYTQTHHLPMVNYLIEIKSDPKTDSFAQPEPETMVRLIMEDLIPKKLGDRLIIQSFDMRPLQVMHKRYPKVALGFLTGDAKASFDDNLKELGFSPTFYNPVNKLVNAELVDNCHKKGILITPWTVNDVPEMKRVKELHVDGIITDYANLLDELK